MYKYLFGPVPSRRLGMSLGIDLVPHKVCSLNCIYCECGRTTDLTIERKEYVPYKSVISELQHYLNSHPIPDYITFSGSGEPTLNLRIGDVLRFIKTYYAHVPVAVLTNGTLLNDEQVRKELLAADVVLPSLDAVSDLAFQKINRPHHDLNIQNHLRGLAAFRKEYTGKIWLEVFIIPGYNDNKEELAQIKQAIETLQPDRVQLNTLDRPGVVSSIRAATKTELTHILKHWNIANAEITPAAPTRKKMQSFRRDIESVMLGTITRRPCTVNDLVKILGLHVNEVNKYLGVLEADGRIKTVKQKRGYFYKVDKSEFTEQRH